MVFYRAVCTTIILAFCTFSVFYNFLSHTVQIFIVDVQTGFRFRFASLPGENGKYLLNARFITWFNL